MKSRLLYRHIFPYWGFLLVKTLSATYRIRSINAQAEHAIINAGQVPIYAAWHQRLFAGITFLAERRPITIMISRSNDGDLVSKVTELTGWNPVRGLSSGYFFTTRLKHATRYHIFRRGRDVI